MPKIYTDKQGRLRKCGCENEECYKRASYGVDSGKPTHCTIHKSNSMRNVVSPTCQADGCHQIPNFGFDKGKALFCSDHKEPDMIDVKHKRCEEKDCDRQPVFGLANGKATHCAEHKTTDMIDVKSKLCLECSVRASYNFQGKPANYCVKHKKDGMIIVSKDYYCKHDECMSSATYGFENCKAEYCAKHALQCMMDVANPKCKSCRMSQSTKKFESHCMRCYINLYPDQKISKDYRIKETHVCDYIKSQSYENVIITMNKTIAGGCSKRRPDILIEAGDYNIIIEVDEEQHNTIDYCACENKRTMELFQDLGNVPLVMIRFNPDAYTDSKGSKKRSCFRSHKKLDVPLIANTEDWENRLKVLGQRIQHYLANIPEKEVTEEHLFYDGWVL